VVQTSVSSDRTEEKKRQILLAASSVFRRRGLHATGMRDIAAELGMHVGNLYYYFQNKRELLAFCQVETLSRLLERAARVQKESCRVDRRLDRLIRGHIQTLNEEIPGSLAHMEVEALAPSRRGEILRQRDSYERVYRELIEEGMEAGVFRATDAKLAALAILGALNWTVKWFRPDGEKPVQQIGEEFARFMVRGLLAPGVEADVRSAEGSDGG
jgi:AcrR family transcriptional regulator